MTITAGFARSKLSLQSATQDPQTASAQAHQVV